MKIAVFYNIEFSGAKRVVKEHVKGLIKLGNTVDVYTTDKEIDIFDPKSIASNSYLYNFSPTRINIPLIKRLKADYIDTFLNLRLIHKKIARDIDRRDYDVVLVHTDTYTQAPFILRYLKSNSVYYCLEPLRNAYEYALRLKDVHFINKIYENLNRHIRKQIDRTNARSAKNILSMSLFGRERIIAAYDLYPEILRLGVNEKLFIPQDLHKKNQIFFGAPKQSIFGYDLAVEALKLIPKEIRPSLKVIYGKEKLSDQMIVKNYNESLLTLSLSKFDVSGLVLLESLSCGIPVIALNVGGYREIIQSDKNGYLVDFKIKEIAQKIMYLMNNPDNAAEMGKSGRKWIMNNWTWDMQVRRLNELLKGYTKAK